MRRPTKKYFKDADGKWRWHTKSSNGNITADSAQGYYNLGDAKRGAWVTLLALLFGRVVTIWGRPNLSMNKRGRTS